MTFWSETWEGAERRRKLLSRKKKEKKREETCLVGLGTLVQLLVVLGQNPLVVLFL